MERFGWQAQIARRNTDSYRTLSGAMTKRGRCSGRSFPGQLLKNLASACQFECLCPLKAASVGIRQSPHEYVEFSLDGTAMSRFTTPSTQSDAIFGAALCDDGTVFAATPGPSAMVSRQVGNSCLSPKQRTMEFHFNERAQAQGQLFGCDGTSLAVTTDDRTSRG